MTAPSREIPRQCWTLGCKRPCHTGYCGPCRIARRRKADHAKIANLDARLLARLAEVATPGPVEDDELPPLRRGRKPKQKPEPKLNGRRYNAKPCSECHVDFIPTGPRSVKCQDCR